MRSSLLIPVMIMIMMIFPLNFSTGDGAPPKREEGISLVPNLVYDNVINVPPGGETRLVITRNGSISEEGYIGHHLETGLLKEAADRLPEWMREDFIDNMLEASSVNFGHGSGAIPAFGDLDADGDEDLVIGALGNLFFFRNIGTQGNPVYIQGDWTDWSHYIQVGDPTESFISPSILDIEGDGYGDILWGDSTEYLHMIWNRGIGNGIEDDDSWTSWAYITSQNPPTHISPAPITGENNTIRLYFGCRQGQLYYWEFRVTDYGTSLGTEMYMAPSLMIGLGTRNFSSPRLFKDPRIAPEYHNIHGMAVGSGDGIIKYYPLIDGHYTQSQTGFFLNIATEGRVTPVPADLNGDYNVDLVLDSEAGSLPLYINFATNDEPFWAPDPHVPAFEVENYESAFDERLKFHDETLIESYISTIIDAEDQRYIDEIGFCCAFTPPDQLRGNRLSQIFVENAKYIYERETQLDYVDIKEYSGNDFYTTTSYKVKVGGEFEWMEIPKEAYYWGVVHPRITEETVSYIDPETGMGADPSDGGRFWREYIWEHADDEYPQGPNYPDDHSGRYVYYPRNFTPPLLKAALEDVEYMWDLQPYNYPAGFDDAGEINNHPWDYKDHALEKISHWVEKTLPLNQQESLDEERPTQPVRIAVTHNGNCGELQDLTIAAARSALIPSRGVHLPGEDHVWSEFYLGGWHQWDNYWSDAGGVIANDLNYWWGWGGRGGSGVWASNGAGQPIDVGERYRSPDITGKLMVQVIDNERKPIDGARVLVMSHWVTEQVNVDTGPYQGPLPSVPLPAIWGYTDAYGICILNVWRQNINIRVTSDLGTYVSQKFSIPEDEGLTVKVVRLQSNKPQLLIPSSNIPVPDKGDRYLASFEIVGSYQDQEDLLGDGSYRHSLEIGASLFEVYLGSQGTGNKIHAGDLNWWNGITILEFRSGGEEIICSFSDMNLIKDHALVRVKIWKVEEVEGEDEPDLILANGDGKLDQGVNNKDDEYIRGWIISNEESMLGSLRYVRVGGPLWDEDFVLDDEPQMNWSRMISGNHFIGIPGERNHLSVSIFDEVGDNASEPVATFDWKPYIKNVKGPKWQERYAVDGISWGKEFDMGSTYHDYYGGLKGIGWIDDEKVWEKDCVTAGWPTQEISQRINSSDFNGGNHRLAITCIDPCGGIQPLTYGFRFHPIAPTLNITSPEEGDEIYSNEVPVSGDFWDDVSLGSISVRIDEVVHDITESVRNDSTFESTIDFMGEPGIYQIEVNVSDNVGLWTSKIVNFTLKAPPDTIPPVIRLESPLDGTRIEKGEKVTIRGTANDNTGLTKLDLTAMGVTYNILDEIVGKTFSLSLDTSSWSTGEKKITIRGEDGSGNTAMDSIDLVIYEDIPEFKDKEVPSITINTPVIGEPIIIGSIISVTGKLFDDGPEIEMEFSYDRGETYEDVTSLLSRDWEFDLEVSTLEIVEKLSLGPDALKLALDDYPLLFRIKDGAGRELFHEYSISLVDNEQPTLYPAAVEMDLESNRVLIDMNVIDNTPVHHLEVKVLTPDGDLFRKYILENRDMRRVNERWACSLEVIGPFSSGTYSITVTAYDAWGNSDQTFSDFTIDEEEERSGLNPLVIIIPLIIALIFVPLLIFGMLGIFSRRNLLK